MARSVGWRSATIRIGRPRCSSARISWAMKVSDSRGYPLRTNAVVGAVVMGCGRSLAAAQAEQAFASGGIADERARDHAAEPEVAALGDGFVAGQQARD